MNETRYDRYNPADVDLSVVVLKSLLLGIVFSVNMTFIVLHWLQIVSTPVLQLHLYLVFWCLFHTLEFLSTCLYNNSQVDDDSFILEDKDIHTMNALIVVEFLIRKYFFTSSPWKMTYFSILIVIVSQLCRTLAMYTARESFNHLIQREHNQSHKLVTHGIYSVSRHPSYFGFWWWFIGLQLMMNNVITTAVGGYVLWNFFNKRIQFEEGFLVKFFGEEYVKYRESTTVGIPFIR